MLNKSAKFYKGTDGADFGSNQLCLLAKCFKPAVPFLELDMMDICKENGAYDAKHFLCYYYYGGMIYTGLKNFERALYFFEQVLSQGFSLLQRQ